MTNNVAKIADITLSLAQVVPATEAEGPGRRFAIWFQGCPLRCEDCCNPEMLSFSGGNQVSLSNLVHQLECAVEEHKIEGITLLGGEPVAHAIGAVAIAYRARELGLSVMLFSGYRLDQLRKRLDPSVHALLNLTDILVDGPYLPDQPDQTRRWIGSTNQQIHFLTDRYQADDPCWRQSDTLEIRFDGTSLTVNGFPSREISHFWKRPGSEP